MKQVYIPDSNSIITLGGSLFVHRDMFVTRTNNFFLDQVNIINIYFKLKSELEYNMYWLVFRAGLILIIYLILLFRKINILICIKIKAPVRTGSVILVFHFFLYLILQNNLINHFLWFYTFLVCFWTNIVSHPVPSPGIVDPHDMD